MTKVERAETAREFMQSATKEDYIINHTVLLLWVNPFDGSLCHRSGAFESYNEAYLFAQELNHEYSQNKLIFQIYIDNFVEFSNPKFNNEVPM